MKIGICAVGRMKAGPEKELADRYFDRFAKAGPSLGLEFGGLFEIPESRLAGVDERRRDEAARLRPGLAAGAALVVLDERGKSISSEAFASKLALWRDGGQKACALLIGGPDGHDSAIRDEASLLLSFGAMTWPHQLARIMLAEQLYRAATILSGHPYHRA
ncbi:MAG: 23S rRNA (pseudouridine(1915)-N(3))-methyltransferase RlmH [Rhizobiaceae bacterium]|nr:23S rRNA (pseudouridine(1915)-N(3))-methyltransferase RlmH [Rhizobiaceae bacterium]